MYEKNNLDTFRILFLIKGILALIASFIPLMYAFLGKTFGALAEQSHDPPPFDVGNIFMVFGLIGFVFLVTMGILAILASKYIREERNYTFIVVASIVNALSGILGILLCIFTLIELNKNYAREIFGRPVAGPRPVNP